MILITLKKNVAIFLHNWFGFFGGEVMVIYHKNVLTPKPKEGKC